MSLKIANSLLQPYIPWANELTNGNTAFKWKLRNESCTATDESA